MSDFLARPASTATRRALFQIHLWLGISLCLYVTVVCVSGAALLFRIDFQRAAHPDLFTPASQGPLTEAATVLEEVRGAYPDSRVLGVAAPTTARPTYLAYIRRDGKLGTIFLDPVTAEILGELPDRSPMRVVQDLHFSLLAGKTGEKAHGIAAVCLLGMCLTGLFLWWSGPDKWRRRLLVNFSRTWSRVLRDLHYAIGIWTVAWLAMWSVSGLYLLYPEPFHAAVNVVSPLAVSRAPQSTPPDANFVEPPAPRALIDGARSAVAADLFVAHVSLPSTDSDAFLVLFSKRSPTPVADDLTRVYLDQYSGRVLDTTRSSRGVGDLILGSMVPLHMATFGGRGVKAVWALFGLAPAFLAATGFLLWWKRVVRR